MKTFAIGYPGTTAVQLWCFVTGFTTYGSVTFDVINDGAWSGELTETGILLCTSFPGEVALHARPLWHGEVPLSIRTGRGPQEALAWIQSQIDAAPVQAHQDAQHALFGRGSS